METEKVPIDAVLRLLMGEMARVTCRVEALTAYLREKDPEAATAMAEMVQIAVPVRTEELLRSLGLKPQNWLLLAPLPDSPRSEDETP